MPAEKAQALVLRTTDWSESSRIATLWTREFGKVRVLAKGGRRLKSNFENALDLLTLCRIVFLRKSSSSLDLLTEAQVVERFPRLRTDLPALYAAYYIAELLSDWTEDYDPHPLLFDEALAALRTLGQADTIAQSTGLRLARFELVLLRELGLRKQAAFLFPVPFSTFIGVSLTLLGMVVIIVALLNFLHIRVAIDAETFHPPTQFAILLTVLTSLIGLLLAVYLLLNTTAALMKPASLLAV